MGHHLEYALRRACRCQEWAGHSAVPLLSAILLLVALPLLPGTATHAATPYRFDSAGYLGAAHLMPDWADTMTRQQAEAPALDACLADADACPRYYRGLRHLLRKARTLPADRQISLISHYVNRKRYTWDQSEKLDTPLSEGPVNYKSRWATVEEFMRRGGDCEDYATTKYYLLRRLGFHADQLRVVVTWDRKERGYHAVLAVHHGNDVLLLESDNTIRRGSRHRYRFIYSINEDSIWDHEAGKTSASRKPSASRIQSNTNQQKDTPA